MVGSAQTGYCAPIGSAAALGFFSIQMQECRRRDSNPHASRRHPLKMVCLPIPPLRRSLYFFSGVAGGTGAFCCCGCCCAGACCCCCDCAGCCCCCCWPGAGCCCCG